MNGCGQPFSAASINSRGQRQAIAAFAKRSRLELVGEFTGDGLHGRLWGVAREVMGGILKFLRFSALNWWRRRQKTA